MVELSPEAKKLLAQLREVDDPSPEERQSAHAAAQRMLRAQGLRTLPRMPASLKTAAAGGGGVVKLVWGLGIFAALGLLATLAMRTPEQSLSAEVARQPAPSAPTPQPAPQQLPPQEAALPLPVQSQPQVAPVKQLPSTRTASSSLAAELRFVSLVDAEIREGAYDSALHRLEHHKGTQLQEERAALRVLALCGRDNDRHAARARAKFLKSSPSSVLAARIEAACLGAGEP